MASVSSAWTQRSALAQRSPGCVDMHGGSGVSKAVRQDCLLVQPFLSLLRTVAHPPAPWKDSRNALLEELTHFVTVPCCLGLPQLSWQIRKGLEKDVRRTIRDVESLPTEAQSGWFIQHRDPRVSGLYFK